MDRADGAGSEAAADAGTSGAAAGTPARGHIDGIYDGILTGWAVTGEGEPCAVTVLVNGQAAGSAPATLPRPDVAAAGLGNGLGGWQVPIAAALTEAANRIDVRFADGAALPGSPLSGIPGARRAGYAGAIEVDQPPVLRGWAIAADKSATSVTLEIEDRAPITVPAAEPRPDLAARGITGGDGGWSFDVSALLLPGTNHIRLRLPDGNELLGSPIEIVHRVGAQDAVGAGYIGALDSILAPDIAGWAVDGNRDPAPVTIVIDDGPPITVDANEPRPDLLASLSKGRGGWRLNLVGLLRPGTNHIRACFPDGSDLLGSPFDIRIPGGAADEIALPPARPAAPSTPPPPASPAMPAPPAPPSPVPPSPLPAGAAPSAPPIASPAPAPATPPRPMPDPTPDPTPAATDPADHDRPLSLTELDEISIDDLVDVVASGIFDFSVPEEDAPPPPDTKAGDAADAPPPRRPGAFSKFLGRWRRDG